MTVVTVKNAAGVAIRTAQYAYDVFDRRIAKVVDPDGVGSAVASTERFVYDGDDIVLSFDGSGTQTHRYLYGTGVDQVLADENAAGQVLWALADHQGTVRDLVNSAGTVVNHITYDSYGNVKGQTNPAVEFRFGYTGRELDGETGQYYYRARYYDAAVGRFISEDTIGFAAGDANLYRYVFNSPTNFTDPTGNIALAAPVVVGGGLLLLGGAYILNNPQAREVVRDLPKHLPSLLNNLNPFRVDPLANGEVRQPERFPKRTPVDGVGGVGGFNDGERVYLPNNTGHPRSSGVETGTRPFPGNVPLDRPHVETFPNCYDPLLSPPFFQSGKGQYSNLFPQDDYDPLVKRREIFHDGKKWRYRGAGGKILTPDGVYLYVYQNNKILISRRRAGHIDVAQGENVDYAGEIKFTRGNNKGELIYWNNNSGHYKPKAVDARNVPLPQDKFEPVEKYRSVQQ